MRARIGQEFDIATGNTVRQGHITSITPNRVEFELGNEIPAVGSVPVTLVLSIFKFADRKIQAVRMARFGAVTCFFWSAGILRRGPHQCRSQQDGNQCRANLNPLQHGHFLPECEIVSLLLILFPSCDL